MCVIACKYFEGTGFVGVKNRDRNYKPSVEVKQSFRKGVERLMFWDDRTKYAEGVNEFGVCILSSAVAVKRDEKEGSKGRGKGGGKGKKRAVFYSPDGKKIRGALLLKTPKDAVKYLIEKQLPGNTLVFNSQEAYLLEATFTPNKESFVHKLIKLAKDKPMVRTNHGILIKSGYVPDSGSDWMEDSYQSSKIRREKVLDALDSIDDPDKMLDAISDSSSDDDFMLNPLRHSDERGKKSILVTTGQIMLVPQDRMMYYRPIWCEVKFNFNKLESRESQTYFQMISCKKLIKETTFKEFYFNSSDQFTFP
jgi:hypothetical protein